MAGGAEEVLDGTFLAFMCASMHELWQVRQEEGAAEPHAEQDLMYVQLHAAILLGLLIFQCAGLRRQALQLVDVGRLSKDMARGLDFYERQGALDASSKTLLEDAIRCLCA